VGILARPDALTQAGMPVPQENLTEKRETIMTQTNRTILVIGATGAMGRPIIRQLLADKKNQWHLKLIIC
jgi:FlaA1/EpsC-like NDP-sugar epimerase